MARQFAGNVAVRRGVSAALAVAAFGVGMSVLHGAGGGTRAAIGNLSAPWLLLAFAAGALYGRGRLLRGAGAGLAATVGALSAFYLANIWTLHLTGHSFQAEVRLVLLSGLYYIRLGLLSGPVLGLVGAAWHRFRWFALEILLALLVAVEPLAWFAYFGRIGPVGALPVGLSESAVGVIGLVALLCHHRASRGSATQGAA